MNLYTPKACQKLDAESNDYEPMTWGILPDAMLYVPCLKVCFETVVVVSSTSVEAVEDPAATLGFGIVFPLSVPTDSLSRGAELS